MLDERNHVDELVTEAAKEGERELAMSRAARSSAMVRRRRENSKIVRSPWESFRNVASR